MKFKVRVKGHQPGQIEEVLEKLTKEDWLDNQPFSGDIIFIYVNPYSTINLEKFEKKVKARISLLLQRHCPIDQYYFCYVDKIDSASIWGHTLDKLIELIKGTWENNGKELKRAAEEDSDSDSRASNMSQKVLVTRGRGSFRGALSVGRTK